MKKQIQYFILAFLFVGTIQAQFDWTWIGGSSTNVNVTPVFGTQGVAASTNYPGSRLNPVTWTDNAGNLWLFGGYSPNYGMMSDLWRYQPSTGNWTFMKGPTNGNQFGVYGSQGTGNTNNNPGARYFSSGWADNNGNLYLFGGYGNSSNSSYVFNNDLWRYNISSNTWTWLKGSSTGYAMATPGTQGVGSSGNTPGARYTANMTRDANGNGWLYGGYGYNANSSGQMNDLWKFDLSTGNWIFISGSMTNSNFYGTTATQGVATTSGRPGGRETTSMSYDNSGNIYLFGGIGYSTNNNGYLNDLWKYNPSNGEWTWLKGSITSLYIYGSYGTIGVPSSANSPGSCYNYGSNSMVYDQTGNLWLLPSYGYAQNNTGRLNALWRYNISTNEWTWMEGSSNVNQSGTYGTLNTSSPNNTPGARDQTSGFATSEAIYLLGGYGYNSNNYGYINDFWRYDICNYAASPTNSTLTNNLTVCSGNTTTLSATSPSATIRWYTSPTSTASIGTGTNVVISSSLMTSALSPSMVTFYSASSVSCGENPNRTAISVTVNPRPNVSVNSATLCQGSIFIMQPSGANSYTYSNGSPTVMASSNQNFTVTGTNQLGCTSTLAAVASLSVLPLPTLSINSGSVCQGSSFVLTPSGAATYTLSSNNATVTPQSTSNYFVTGTGANGCAASNTAIATVFVYNLPMVSANNGTVCAGGTFTILPQGASTYTISGGSNVVTPTSSSIYTITGANQYGCVSSNTAYASVVVNPLPTVTAVGSAICQGQSVTLLASGASNYTYSSGSNVVTPSVTTSYSIVGSSLAGCNSAAPAVLTITVNTLPVLSLNSGSICAGNSFTLIPSGAATYTFINGGPVVTPNTTTSYYLTGTSAEGCNSAANAVGTVTVYQLPVITADNGNICIGQSFSLNPNGASVYTITGGNAVVTPTATSQYTIVGVSAEGCENLTGVVSTVIVNALPIITGSAYSPTICAGESATLLATGGSAYMWANSNGSQNTSVGYAVITPTATTVYTITGYSDEGCEASVVVTQNVAECAGITQNELTGFNVYPNPNNGAFYIDAPYNANYSVLNAAGQIISEGQTQAGQTQINLNNYSNGLYMVRISTSTQTTVIKVIKQ